MSEIGRRNSADALRKKEITLIHVLAGQLGLDEETRRAMYRSKTGKSSATDMTWQDRKKVLDHLKESGAKVTTPRKAGRPRPATPSRALDVSAMASKVRALWIGLADLGVVRDRSESALAAYVKRITKVDDLSWCGGEQLETLIESLKKWVIRECVKAVPDLLAEVRVACSDPVALARIENDCRRLLSTTARPRMSAEGAQDLVLEMRKMIGAR